MMFAIVIAFLHFLLLKIGLEPQQTLFGDWHQWLRM